MSELAVLGSFTYAFSSLWRLLSSSRLQAGWGMPRVAGGVRPLEADREMLLKTELERPLEDSGEKLLESGRETPQEIEVKRPLESG